MTVLLDLGLGLAALLSAQLALAWGELASYPMHSDKSALAGFGLCLSKSTRDAAIREAGVIRPVIFEFPAKHVTVELFGGGDVSSAKFDIVDPVILVRHVFRWSPSPVSCEQMAAQTRREDYVPWW